MLSEAEAVLRDGDDLLSEYREEPVETDVADALELDSADDIEPGPDLGDDADDADTGPDDANDGLDGGFSFETDGPDDGEATTDGGDALFGDEFDDRVGGEES